jgi:UDPglucose 6-dehydrogenase
VRISVIGLGKLGAPLAAVLAAKGFDVIGVDHHPSIVAALAAGDAPVPEPGLGRVIDDARSRLTATTNIADAVARTETTFVIVPTPSKADGTFSNAQVIAAVREIGAALRAKTGYHLVVITSTVMPGTTGGPIRDALEATAGRPVGQTIGLCYGPLFVALGSVIENMLNPDFVLIGEFDPRSGDALADIYRAVCDNRPAMQRMSFVNAELTKLAVNTYVTMKISFANTLSTICDQMPESDAKVVAAAIGRDTRIGAKYLSPGLGYGGPCFPRDNAALANLTRELGARADLIEATDRINRAQPARLVNLVQRLLARGTIGILGLSYKPDTSVIEQSQGIEIAALLAQAGYRVRVFDPQCLDAAIAVLGKQVEAAPTAEDCTAEADLLVIATPWRCFLQLPERALTRSGGRRLIIVDCWHLLPRAAFAPLVDLIYPGEGIRLPLPMVGAKMPPAAQS